MVKIILVNRLLIAVKACPKCGGDLFLEYKDKWYKCFKCSRYFFQFLGKEASEERKIFVDRKKKLLWIISQNIKDSTVRSPKEH